MWGWDLSVGNDLSSDRYVRPTKKVRRRVGYREGSTIRNKGIFVCGREVYTWGGTE